MERILLYVICAIKGTLRREGKMNELFKKRLGEELKKMNMTQRELAETIGVNETTISRYITGEREPKYEVMANIATALHTTVAYLLGENEEVYSFPKVKCILARNAGSLTEKEKCELINVILEG